MDTSTIITIIGIAVAIIIGIWQIWLARKQIRLSETPTNKGAKQSSVQTDNHSIAVGKIEIGVPVSGNIIIDNTHHTTIEEIALNQTLFETSENKYRERPYPNEIINEIDELPIFQKETACNNYIGLRVRWQTSLFTIRKVRENFFELMMKDRGNYPWIYCTVNILEYPELKIIKEGHSIWIDGEISTIYNNDIHLINSKIRVE